MNNQAALFLLFSLNIDGRGMLAPPHLQVSPPLLANSPVENSFAWDRSSVSSDCQPAPITQRVQTHLKVIRLLHHFISPFAGPSPTTTRRQTRAGTPAGSFELDIFHVFVLLRNLLSYFPVQPRRLPAKEMPLRLWKEFFLKAGGDGNLRVLHHSSSLHCAVFGSTCASPYRNSF